MRFTAPNFYWNNTSATSDMSAAVSDSLNDMENDLNLSRISLPNNDSESVDKNDSHNSSIGLSVNIDAYINNGENINVSETLEILIFLQSMKY